MAALTRTLRPPAGHGRPRGCASPRRRCWRAGGSATTAEKYACRGLCNRRGCNGGSRQLSLSSDGVDGYITCTTENENKAEL